MPNNSTKEEYSYNNILKIGDENGFLGLAEFTGIITLQRPENWHIFCFTTDISYVEQNLITSKNLTKITKILVNNATKIGDISVKSVPSCHNCTDYAFCGWAAEEEYPCPEFEHITWLQKLINRLNLTQIFSNLSKKR